MTKAKLLRHPGRTTTWVLLLALASCKPIGQTGRLSEAVAVGEGDLPSMLETIEEQLAASQALAFDLEMGSATGTDIVAAESGAMLPADGAAEERRQPKTPDGRETAFALTEDEEPAEPAPAGPRTFAPLEVLSRIQEVEVALAESERRQRVLLPNVEVYRKLVLEYRNKPNGDATVLASMESSLRFQQETASALEATNKSMRLLYDRALAVLNAQNLKIQSLEGDVQTLDAKMRELAEKVTTVVVRTSADDRREVLDAATFSSGDGVEFQDSAFFHHPRAEASFTRIDSFGVTGSVGFEKGFVGGQAAVHYEIRYGVETLVAAAPGMDTSADDGLGASVVRPLFTAIGVTNRETSSFCIVFASHIVNPSTQFGVNLGVVSASAMASRLDQSDSRRISAIYHDDKGVSFGKIKQRCDQFYEKVMREAPPAGDLAGIRPNYIHQAAACFSDIDCKDGTKGLLPGVDGYMVSECRYKAEGKKGICETRVVEGEAARDGHACHPTTFSYGFVWPCAKGLTCTGYESSWLGETPGKCMYTPAASIGDEELNGPGKIKLRNWSRGLAHVGLDARKIKHAGQLTVAAMTPATLAKVCEARGLKSTDGWRLPTVRELWAIGVYDRETVRGRLFDRLVKRGGFFRAADWYYADEAFTGVIWSSDSFVYLKQRQGTVPVALADRASVTKVVPENVAGELYCVQGRLEPLDDLGD